MKDSLLHSASFHQTICTPLWIILHVNLDSSLSAKEHSAMVRLTMVKPFSGYFIVPSSHMRFTYFFSDYGEFLERMKHFYSPDGISFTSRDRADPAGKPLVSREELQSVVRLSLSVSQKKEWQGTLTCPYLHTEFSFRSRERFEQLIRERVV